MKKRIWICVLLACFLFILSPAFLHAQNEFGDESGLGRVIRALEEIPRKSFSMDERSLLADYGGFESSLLVSGQIPAGERPAGTFILAVPLGAAFAVDTALAVAEKMGDDNVNVLVAFLGGEKNTLPEDMGGFSHKGLRDLLTLTDLPENRVICYFDADIVPDGLVLSHGSRGYLAPLEIIDPLPPLFTSYGIPWSFEIGYNSFYTLGFAEGREALSIIRREEVNGFVLSGAETNGEKFRTAETAGKNISHRDLADLLLDYAGTLQFPVINPDKNYSVFAFPGGKIFFSGEKLTVIFLLVTMGAFLFFYLLYSVQHNVVLFFYLRRFVKTIWIFLILFLLLILSIKLSGFVYSLLVRIFNKPESVSYASFILVLLLSLFLFLLCDRRIIRKIPFRLRERFYGFSSVILIVLGMFSAAFIDISVIPIFIWAFVFVILGAFLPSVIAIFLCSLSVPVFALFAIFSIFTVSGGGADTIAGNAISRVTGGGRIAELFIFSGWAAPDAWVVIFLTAILSLPSFLLFMRGIVLATIKLKRNPLPVFWRKNRRACLSVMILAVILAMFVQIQIPGRQVSYTRRHIADAAEAESVFTLSLDSVIFQSSRIITVTLAAEGNPKRFDISIEAETENTLPPVYASPVPFERENEGRTARFVLGENPPNPLSIEIVLPVEFDGVVNASAIYDEWDPHVDKSENPASGNYILRVSRSADLKSRENHQPNSTPIPSADESSP